MRVWLVLAVLAACGRFDFDARNDAGGSPGGDAQKLADAHPDSANADIQFVQSGGNSLGAVLTISQAFPSALQAGDLVLVGASLDGPPPTVIFSDTQSNAFTTCSKGVAEAAVVYLAYTYAKTGADTVTFTVNAAPNSYLELAVWDFRGLTGAPDACAQASGQSLAMSAVVTPSLTATRSEELLFAWGVYDGSGSVDPGFTAVSNYDTDPAEDKLLGAPGSYTATETMLPGGTNWTIVGATFRSN